MLLMFSKQIHLQIPPKSFGVNSGIPQMVRQWIPDCQSGNRKCTGSKGATANTWNWQFTGMTAGRSQILTTRNFGDWHTVVGEVPRSSMLKTTMDCHSKLVLHSLSNNQPVQVIMHQLWQTTLIFPGPCEQTCCSIFEHTAACPWPSVKKTKESYSSRYKMWQRRGLMSLSTHCPVSDEHVSADEARRNLQCICS